MKTTHKIAGARAIYRVVRAGRAIIGRTDRDIVVRGGINYELDLSQGIDFAIYLGNIYERQTRAALRRLVSPASLVLDIGANIGAHTLHLATAASSRLSRPTMLFASLAATSNSTRNSSPG